MFAAPYIMERLFFEFKVCREIQMRSVVFSRGVNLIVLTEDGLALGVGIIKNHAVLSIVFGKYTVRDVEFDTNKIIE